MFWRLVWNSLRHSRQKRFLAVLTIAVGSSLVTAVLSISLDVGDKVNRELKAYGANIILDPLLSGEELSAPSPSGRAAFLAEEDLPRIKMIFWRNNIIDFTPFLEAPVKVKEGKESFPLVGTWFNHTLKLPTGEAVITGVRSLKGWWRVDGRWPEEGRAEVLAGQTLARQLGLRVGAEVALYPESGPPEKVLISGLLDTGEEEEDWIVAPLGLVQELAGWEGKVDRVEISALTTPENELARRAAADPQSLSQEEFETWYCTAYISTITYQLEEAIPSARARAQRQVTEAEGAVLGKIQLLMWLLAAMALLSSALGVSNLMHSRVRERQQEIGLAKALGAPGSTVAFIFWTEVLLEGLLGGVIGYGLGLGLAWFIGRAAFDLVITPQLLVLPLVLLLAALVTLGGSAAGLVFVLRLRPAEVLRGS